MTMMDQASIVLYTMHALQAEGSWCGETHVQKTVFLCQEVVGVPSHFKFILYKHGPYSFDLSEHLQGLIADDLVRVITKPPYGPSLNVSSDGEPIASEIENREDVSRRIVFISKKVGRKNVAELEKLATAVFVNRKYGSSTPADRRAEILSSLKPHVSVEAAREAVTEAEVLEVEARGVAG